MKERERDADGGPPDNNEPPERGSKEGGTAIGDGLPQAVEEKRRFLPPARGRAGSKLAISNRRSLMSLDAQA